MLTSGFQQGKDIHFAHQAFIVYSYTLVAVVYFGVFGLISVFIYRNGVLGYVHGVGLALSMIAVAVARFTRQLEVAKNLLILMGVMVLTAYLVTGGIEETGIFFFAAFPPWSFFLIGRRKGAVWVGLLSLASTAVLALHLLRDISIPYSPVTVGILFVSLFVISAFIWLFEQSREKYEILAETSRTRLHETNARLANEIEEHMHAEVALREANEKLTRSMVDLKEHTREITRLNQMSGLLQSCLTTAEAYLVIAQSVRSLFPAEGGALYIISASRNLVEAVAMWGPAQAESGERVFAPGDCWALRHGRIHLVEDSHTGLRCRHLTDRSPVASLCVPMMAQGEALGILQLVSAPVGLPRDRPMPDPPETVRANSLVTKQQLAQTVADSIALALANLRLRETLRTQSIRDPLTGLFNRRYMEETLEREIRRAARNQSALGIIIFDIDHFKRFNDTYGHAAGDVLLQELGQFLKTHGEEEDIACRYGGEEFTLILPGVGLTVLHQRAEDLRASIKRLGLQYRGQPLGAISLSLGLALFPEHGATAETLQRAADQALYRAKHEGRDRVAIAPEQTRREDSTDDA